MMGKIKNITELIQFAWINGLYNKTTALSTTQGRNVTVINAGNINDTIITGAVINIAGVIHNGTIAFNDNASDCKKNKRYIDDAVLYIVNNADQIICKSNGSVIPTIELPLLPEIVDKYSDLVMGNAMHDCASILHHDNIPYSTQLYSRLLSDRMERRYSEFMQIYEQTEKSWDEVLYIILFKTMGRGSNKDAYIKLAKLVPYTHICRINKNIQSVEALLLGASGLLWLNENNTFPDDYISELQKEFEHLSKRFGITPMRLNEWELNKNYKNGHPVIRIAQLTSMLCSKEFMFSKLMECKTIDQIHDNLGATASDYWTFHALPNILESKPSPKSIGGDTLNSIAINLVLPMMFVYGKFKGNSTLQEKGTQLFEDIQAEDNKHIKTWTKAGIRMGNAFSTQAFTELNYLFCADRHCAKCYIGRQLLYYK